MLEVVFSNKKPLAKKTKVILMYEQKNVKADFLTTDEAELVKKAIVQADFCGKTGQFVEVRVDGSPSTFLRRPISVNFVDYDANQLWLLVAAVYLFLTSLVSIPARLLERKEHI